MHSSLSAARRKSAVFVHRKRMVPAVNVDQYKKNDSRAPSKRVIYTRQDDGILFDKISCKTFREIGRFTEKYIGNYARLFLDTSRECVI